jgi:hypothetical protein
MQGITARVWNILGGMGFGTEFIRMVSASGGANALTTTIALPTKLARPPKP